MPLPCKWRRQTFSFGASFSFYHLRIPLDLCLVFFPLVAAVYSLVRWFCLVWLGLVWSGSVWFGSVRFGSLRFFLLCLFFSRLIYNTETPKFLTLFVSFHTVITRVITLFIVVVVVVVDNAVAAVVVVPVALWLLCSFFSSSSCF